MPAIIALVLIAVVIGVIAVAVLGAAVHFLLSPWLLLAAVAILAWVRFRPHRTR